MIYGPHDWTLTEGSPESIPTDLHVAPVREYFPPREPLGRLVAGPEGLRARWVRTLTGGIAVAIRAGEVVTVTPLVDLERAAWGDPTGVAARVLETVVGRPEPAYVPRRVGGGS